MSKRPTTRISLAEDGTVLELTAEGRKEPSESKTDWDRVKAMSDKEALRAAESDPDAKPLTVRQLAGACKVPALIDVRAIRLKRHLSQAAFAKRYGFALDAIQDWEQGRRPPNRYARLLLTVIDKEPEAVERALAS